MGSKALLQNWPKADTKSTIIKIIIAFVLTMCLGAVFFFFFSPGVFLGGMNYISTDSSVRVIQTTYSRAGVIFNVTDEIEHELNAEQTEELRRLLRNSWYARRLRNVILFPIPPELNRYYTFHIEITNATHVTSLTTGGLGNYILRGGDYNDWFRIRNSAWEERILMILSSARCAD